MTAVVRGYASVAGMLAVRVDGDVHEDGFAFGRSGRRCPRLRRTLLHVPFVVLLPVGQLREGHEVLALLRR